MDLWQYLLRGAGGTGRKGSPMKAYKRLKRLCREVHLFSDFQGKFSSSNFSALLFDKGDKTQLFHHVLSVFFFFLITLFCFGCLFLVKKIFSLC